MDKEDVVHIYNGMLLSYKKNEIMPFRATWRDLEIIILNEANQTENSITSLICGALKKKDITSLNAPCNHKQR